MRNTTILTTAFILVVASFAGAASPVVDVTVSIDRPLVGGSYTLGVGETATLSVYAQLQPTHATTGNGIFGWDVDLRASDPSVVDLLAGTVDRSGWTNNPSTSSDGTPTAWGIDAIYDTGEADSELGVSAPIQLFSIDITGTTPGTSLLSIEPDDTSAADFVTWTTDTGGVYTDAFASVTVVPEPGTLLLGVLSAAMVGVFARRRRKTSTV